MHYINQHYLSIYHCLGTERSETIACLSGVPQGYVLGPILYGMYVSPVGDLIAQHNISYHQYADDLQLDMSLSSEDFNDLSAMEICVIDVSRWFVENALLLNPDKTEAVVFGTHKQLPQLYLSRGIDVSAMRIDFAEPIKLLGVFLDANLTFEKRAGCRTWMPFSHQSTTAHQTTSDIGCGEDLRCSHRQ